MTDPVRKDLDRQRLNDPFHEGARAAKARKMRSLAIALGLVLFVALIFAVSILKLSANTHLVNQISHVG